MKLVSEDIQVQVVGSMGRTETGRILLVRSDDGTKGLLYGQKRMRPRVRTIREWRVEL